MLRYRAQGYSLVHLVLVLNSPSAHSCSYFIHGMFTKIVSLIFAAVRYFTISVGGLKRGVRIWPVRHEDLILLLL